MATFSLCYTSRRPHAIVPMATEWFSRAERPSDVEIIIAVDSDDAAAKLAAESVPGAKVVIQADEPYTCVKGWNLAAKHSTGKVLIAMADDFMPPKKWDRRLLNLEPKDWIDHPHVVHVNDGFVNDLCTLAIMTRPRYAYLGNIFYSGYKSIYCDTDLTYHSKQDGVLIHAQHILFEHYHPDRGQEYRQRDSLDMVHSSQERYDQGKVLFENRKTLNFPI